MKKTILILLLIQSASVCAQIRISDFKQVVPDGASVDLRTALTDPEGQLCSVLKLETKQSGWTFDAGTAGIVDTRYEDGIIWVYVPAYARNLTVAHKEYGVLREWGFPVSLEAGRTYTMELSYDRPQPKPVSFNRPLPARPAPSPAQAPAPTRNNPGDTFCSHFVDMYAGSACSKDSDGRYLMDDDYWIGLSYTWIGERIGPYMSLATNFSEEFSVIGGVSFRMTDPSTAGMDWQVYGGAGLIGGSLGADVGTRFAWRSSSSLSHWDFGFGCQFCNGNIMPTVSVGFYIWGIPALIGVGLVVCATGSIL